MENSRGLFWVLITLAIIHTVQAQDQLGIKYLISSIYCHVLPSYSFTNILVLRNALLVLTVNVHHVC